MRKLERLAKLKGFLNSDDMIGVCGMDYALSGICTNPGCDFIKDVEPDSSTGYCEECKTNTVSSMMVLAGFI